MKTTAKSLVVSVCFLFWCLATSLAATNTIQIFNFNFGALPSTHMLTRSLLSATPLCVGLDEWDS